MNHTRIGTKNKNSDLSYKIEQPTNQMTITFIDYINFTDLYRNTTQFKFNEVSAPQKTVDSTPKTPTLVIAYVIQNLKLEITGIGTINHKPNNKTNLA